MAALIVVCLICGHDYTDADALDCDACATGLAPKPFGAVAAAPIDPRPAALREAIRRRIHERVKGAKR